MGCFHPLFGGAGRKAAEKLAMAAASPSGPTDPLEVFVKASLGLRPGADNSRRDIEAHTAPAIR